MDKIRMEIVTFGCDPEIFVRRGKTIIGSERIIPEEGLKAGRPYDLHGKLVRDGIQAELNPRQTTCRANLGNYIKGLLSKLDKELEKQKNMVICFDQVVMITKKELNSLSPKSRQFGCMPSFNIYDTAEFKAGITVDPAKYLKRSGGGHLHLGDNGYDGTVRTALHDYSRIVPLLDLIVGNTCVLLDRNPLNAERRRVYGRAGEFRTPTYGVEYRTLSNFWLRDYQLFSLVTGLARTAVSILANTTKENNYYDDIMKLVDMKDIQKAINDNDYDMAKKNWNKIKKWLIENVDDNKNMNYSSPIQRDTIKLFDYFIEKGVDYWFGKTDKQILHNWITQPEGHEIGFERFLDRVVRKSKKTKRKVNWHTLKGYEDYDDEEEYEEDYDNEEE
jgi:hypothetical protein